MGSIKGLRRGRYNKKRKDFLCLRCNKLYKKHSSLTQHIRSVHLNIQIVCSFCNKPFKSKSTLNRHTRKSHNGVTQRLSGTQKKHQPIFQTPSMRVIHRSSLMPHFHPCQEYCVSKPTGNMEYTW